MSDEQALASLALALGAESLGPLSESERELATNARAIRPSALSEVREAIHAGMDPLGDSFCRLRSAAERRPMGATYTPRIIVSAMTDWVASRSPELIVDPGAGSGRFLIAAARALPRVRLLAVEVDPLAALLCRAHVVTAGFGKRAQVVVRDFRDFRLPDGVGRTAFLGNPPYVRHHQIDSGWKSWLVQKASSLGVAASQLAGLHAHFFLATATLARKGDFGVFITAAEWLDVNYGALVRKLFLGRLGGESLHVLEPKAQAFPDAASTAAISCFTVGSQTKTVFLRRVASLEQLAPLEGGRAVRRERLEMSNRWTPLTHATRKTPEGYVELGELCRVHRGQVTGFNKVWIEGPHSKEMPDFLLFPSVTRARELFDARGILDTSQRLKRVIDLPVDLDCLDIDSRKAVNRFLRYARGVGADRGFIAQHRKAWWSVGLRDPAPILATYMARRPPAFVRNLTDARHLNIAHGIYPREKLSSRMLDALVRYLSSNISVQDGRTYAGGLTKFEPKEMERLAVPGPELLKSDSM